jgi:hypothetical protein
MRMVAIPSRVERNPGPSTPDRPGWSFLARGPPTSQNLGGLATGEAGELRGLATIHCSAGEATLRFDRADAALRASQRDRMLTVPDEIV